MGFLSEFKEFAVRGNVVDLAVAVVIGGAFGKIVTSLVNDIVMPVIGKLVGGVSTTARSLKLTPPTDEVLLLREIRDALQARQS